MFFVEHRLELPVCVLGSDESFTHSDDDPREIVHLQPPMNTNLTAEAELLHRLRALPRVDGAVFTILEPTPDQSLRAPLDFCRHPDQISKALSTLLRVPEGDPHRLDKAKDAAALLGALAEACSFVGVSYELVLARTLANSSTLNKLLR